MTEGNAWKRVLWRHSSVTYKCTCSINYVNLPEYYVSMQDYYVYMQGYLADIQFTYLDFDIGKFTCASTCIWHHVRCNFAIYVIFYRHETIWLNYHTCTYKNIIFVNTIIAHRREKKWTMLQEARLSLSWAVCIV